jgi:hypothetical protein
MAIAAAWVSRLTAISLEMVVPGLIGYWLDQKLGSRIVLTLIGFGIGLSLGTWHLIRLAQTGEQGKPSGGENNSSDQQP